MTDDRMIPMDEWPALTPLNALPKVRRRNPEDKLHAIVWRAMQAILTPDVVCWSNENRGNGAREGQRRRARGVIAGVGDMTIHWAPSRCCYIELKTGRVQVSDPQRRLHARLRQIGIETGVCRSLDEVIAFLVEQGVPTRIAAP